jgi:hypothetical protein
MALIQPPPHVSQPSALRTWLKHEWKHFTEMERLPLCFLVFCNILSLLLNPLVPSLAYLLQRWAASPWDWRDRWTSVWIWAKQGRRFIAILFGIVLLGKVRLWFFPELIVMMQALWQAHLPGNLSLSPLDGHTLMARVLLLLPLAPLLALLDEWIDPRTCVRLQRVLTPADLVEPSQSADPPPSPNASTTNQATPQTTPSVDTQEPPVRPPRKAKRPTTNQKRTPQSSQVSSDTGHVIIESVLTTDPAQTKRSAASRPKEMQKTVKKLKVEKLQPKTPPVIKPIDWDDVLE